MAGAAAAFPSGSTSAADTVENLQARGFAVQLNGTVNGPLSECTVTGVHGLNNSNVDEWGRLIDPSQCSTAFVDISCPSNQ